MDYRSFNFASRFYYISIFFSVLNFLQFNLLLFAHTFTFTFVNWAEIYRISIVYGSSKWIPEITVCCALVALNCISNDILYFISNFRLHYHSQLNKNALVLKSHIAALASNHNIREVSFQMHWEHFNATNSNRLLAVSSFKLFNI